MKKNYSFWIKERHNPQLGVYYIKMGQMSKTAAKKAQGSLYGDNYMLEFKTEDEYNKKLNELMWDKASIQ